jgi:FkbM family methyltransferase
MRPVPGSARRPLAGLLDRAATLLRRAVPRGSAAGDRLRRWRHRAVREQPDRPIEVFGDAFAAAHPRASFVQVGSNDGVRFDPICLQVRTRPWTGVMVEPLPAMFERLAAHYGGSRRVRLENAAIADHDGTQAFWFLADAPGEVGLPEWYDLLGTFRRDVLLSHRHAIPDIESRVRSTEVPCLTFESLCRKHALEQIDVVHIDTEGFDYEVVKLIDLDRWQPAVVLYEHLHLSAADRAACAEHLRAAGYRLVSDAMDTLAVRATAIAADGALAEAWRAVERALS